MSRFTTYLDYIDPPSKITAVVEIANNSKFRGLKKLVNGVLNNIAKGERFIGIVHGSEILEDDNFS